MFKTRGAVYRLEPHRLVADQGLLLPQTVSLAKRPLRFG
ncbi:hypothetical protein C4K35_0545 [Pseudomonas chlororaphis subsp. piscium]|nr:hypothetical protein C4K35_0545 [Pseudomonas chlororaphis subsp. piscium]AZC54735.1 hypothetical protein C4K34_0541 [Pseudomonas chlororaphis subsp. piscium]AZC61056.1 hypothetical protein C4K33_0535 [Pseudomonas chlororaphis subsp. piscium]AZC67231.1 hypothetical protein C4K32_0540 [Pseudomonas chlororaphis subsp. piscium]AZC73469.1 hypothetical protein C4K31_0537 [Pseudomonas chlororaphis subsp. piscium]